MIDKYFDTVGGLNTASQQDMNSLKGKLLSQRKKIFLNQWELFVEKNPKCLEEKRKIFTDESKSKSENEMNGYQSLGRNKMLESKEDNYQSKVKGQYQGQYREQYRDQNKEERNQANFLNSNSNVEMTGTISNFRGGLGQDQKILQHTQRTDYKTSSNFPPTQSQPQSHSQSHFQSFPSNLQSQYNPYSNPTAVILSSLF